MARTMTAETNLRIEQSEVDVTSWGSEPDPGWRLVDAAGHGHHYASGYPTLREITETVIDDDGEEWQAHVRWECPHCGEHIVPGNRATFGRSTVPGLRRYFVDEEEVSRETFLAAWKPQAERKLAEQEAAI